MKTKFEQTFWLFVLSLLHHRGVSGEFECPAAGRYLDPLSGCVNYFVCEEKNGGLVYAQFKCPNEQLYSVEEQRCLTASNLECKELTGATPIPLDKEIDVEPIQSFVCRSEGNFINDADPSCQSYINCKRISGQSYIMNLLYCPTETVFSHNAFECVPNEQFQCPTKSENNSTESTTTEEESTTATPEIPTSSETEPSVTEPSTTEATTTISETPTDFVCTRNGRFPNPTEPGCRSYLICKGGGPFTIDVIGCADDQIYSPNHGRCVLPHEYNCPYLLTTTTVEEASSTSHLPETTESITTSDETSTPSPETTSETETSSVSEISESQSPDTTESAISSSSQSPETTSEIDTSSVTDSTTEASTVNTGEETTTIGYDFVCTRTGRFPNLAEPGCGTYILCAQYENGTFVSQINSCGSHYFDPSVGRCSLDYSCDTTTPVTEDTQPTTKIDETTTTIDYSTSTEDPDRTTIKVDTTTKTSTEETDQPSTQEDTSTATPENSSTVTPEIPNFECTRNGRYPNTAESGCQSYLICKGGGPFTIDVIRCADGQLYSPNHGRCVLSHEYTCPSDTLTTTEETLTESQATQITGDPTEPVTTEQTENPISSSTTTDKPSSTIQDRGKI